MAKSIALAAQPFRLASWLLSYLPQYTPSLRLAIRTSRTRSFIDLAICGPLVRSSAIFALSLGCSSQSIEAVGSLSCLQSSELSGCGGAGLGGGSGDAGGGGEIGGDSAGGRARASSGGRNATGGSSTGFANSLLHRYSFDGSGSVAEDSVGEADGTVFNTTLDGMGAVSLVDDHDSKNQTADQFVDLPNQLVSGLRNATFEAWLTWAGGGPYQRIFDFGDDISTIEDNRTSYAGRTYLFLTPRSYPEQGSFMRAAYASLQVHEVELYSVHQFPVNARTHVALVVDSDAEQMALYMNGEFEKSITFAGDRLMLIHDVNNWLGRSNFYYDPCLTGTFHEFRIYSAALSASQVHESFAFGPDAVLPP
jgi:hypothetical protein